MAEQVTKTITVRGDPKLLHDIWSDLEDFPRFMPGVKAVARTDERATKWTIHALGRDFSWVAETTMSEPGKRIAWNTIGGDLKTSGQVVFADLGNGQTSITITVQWQAPGGALGEAVAKLGDAGDWVEKALRAFKEHAESASTGTRPAFGSRAGTARDNSGISAAIEPAEESVTGHTVKGSEPVPGGFAPVIDKKS